jgi:hypothetical protein
MAKKHPCLPPTVTAAQGELLSHPGVNPETSMVLALFPSKSNPSKVHAVARSHKTGDTWCTCPAWRFQRIPAADRVCKHIKRIAAASLAGNGPMVKHEAASELSLATKRNRLAERADAIHRAAKKASKGSK